MRGIFIKNLSGGLCWILVIVAVLALSGSSKSVEAKNVDVSGWNFTAYLGDQWHSNPHATENDDTNGWNSSINMESTDPAYINWKGVLLSNAFYMSNDGAVINPQDLLYNIVLDPNQKDVIATVDIRVHKVPKDVLGWNSHDILSDLCGDVTGSSSKDIEFNGRPALLVERNQDVLRSVQNGSVIIPACSIGGIDILMTDDTVVSLDVVTRPESNLRPWDDVIEKFTISPR